MAHKLGQYAVREVFFENPIKEFHIRQIARKLKMSKTATAYHVNALIKQEIVQPKEDTFRKYAANLMSRKYKVAKLIHALENISESGIVEYLEEKTLPKAIVLFGSFAKAEFDSKSDIDLFVQASEEEIYLEPFEERLKHKIHLLFEPRIGQLSNELLNNIINGIKLSGLLKVK